MGFSVSAATAIIFSAMALSMGILAVMTTEAFDAVRRAGETRVEMLVERERTRLSILDVFFSNGTLSVNASNDGSTTLHVSKTSVLVNGALITSGVSGDAGVAGSDLWLPGEVLRLRIAPSAAPVSVKLVSETGVAAYW
jgi:flagellar protein FlaF